MASCNNISTCVEMPGRSSDLNNREQIPAMKSSLLKTGVRKTSSVTFGESNMIEIKNEEEVHEEEDKENDDKLSKIRENIHCDDEGKI